MTVDLAVAGEGGRRYVESPEEDVSFITTTSGAKVFGKLAGSVESVVEGHGYGDGR